MRGLVWLGKMKWRVLERYCCQLAPFKYLYTDAEHSIVSNPVGTPFSYIFYNLLMKNLAAILRTF